MIKGVIFDMDGVMIDTERQSTLGWLHAFEAHGSEIPMWLINKVHQPISVQNILTSTLRENLITGR